MIQLIAALLIPLHFTAPHDTLGRDAAGQLSISAEPVEAYEFMQRDESGQMTQVPGYADSLGRAFLRPHTPGTRERVWVPVAEAPGTKTIFVIARDRSGNASSLSNPVVISAADWLTLQTVAVPAVRNGLNVPVVSRAPEGSGQAALEMVLRYYGADAPALDETGRAFIPAPAASPIGELAEAARRAGYEAAIATLTPDSLIALLGAGVPPIVLYEAPGGSATPRHFGVVTGWDCAEATFAVHDGSARALVTPREDLSKRWATAGSQALVVRRRPSLGRPSSVAAGSASSRMVPRPQALLP